MGFFSDLFGGGSKQQEQGPTAEETALQDVAQKQWALRKEFMPQIDQPYLQEANRDLSGTLRGRASIDSRLAANNSARPMVGPGGVVGGLGAVDSGASMALGEGLRGGSNAARARTDQALQHVVSTGAKTGANTVSSLGSLASTAANKQARIADSNAAVAASRGNMFGSLAGGAIGGIRQRRSDARMDQMMGHSGLGGQAKPWDNPNNRDPYWG